MRATLGLVAGLLAVPGVALAAEAAGAATTGHYRNLFAEELGKTQAETDAKISAAWEQLFRGDEQTQRLFYPVADDMAYVPDLANLDVRTEGLSYGMMICVQLDRQHEFNQIWKWARTRQYHSSGPMRGYFGWHADFQGRLLDDGPASDGEEWFVTALFFAAHRWGSGAGIYDYEAEAQALLRTMLHKGEEPDRGEATSMFDRAARQIVFAPRAEAALFTDPSYHLPAFYELWARWAAAPEDRAFCAEAAAASRVLFKKAAHPATGLMPDYANFDGTPHARRGHEDFRYDAWRTLSNPALDYAWHAADPWAAEQSNRVLRFLAGLGPVCPNQFKLDGTPLSTVESPGLLAMAATAGLAADADVARPFVQRLWTMEIPDGHYRYYDGLLYLLALLEVSGRFQIYAPPTAVPPPVAFDWFEYTGRDPVFAPPLPPAHFRNPILAGFYPDPSICRVGATGDGAGGDFYLVNSTFAYFPGIPVFHSRDLVNWTQIGHVIDRPSQLNYDGLGVSRGIFAPALSHHLGVFYLVCTFVDGGGNFLMTATNPAGPWSDPVWLNFDGIDPSIFFDDDGRAWLVNNGVPPENKPLYEGHRAIYLQEFDAAARKLTGPRTIIVNGGVDLAKKPVWIEGPHLFKRGGWYYLCCAEGGTGDNHSQVIFRSKAVSGPFLPWERNPILTQRDLDGTVPQAVTTTGHAELVVGPDGNWWSVFLGCRPFGGHYYATGRETFLLPVSWSADGWPLILPPGERVPYSVPAPKVERFDPNALPSTPSETGALGTTRATPGRQAPLTGNFTWRDEFDGPALSPLWTMLRRPHETWWSLDKPKGCLTLAPRADPLSGQGNPSFLGRRLQHAHFEATTALEPPTAAGISAGLVAFQNETHYYYLGVRRTADGLCVFLECANGNLQQTVAAAIVPAAARIELRMTGDDKVCAFAYATVPGEWRTLVPDADATVLTTQAAGGFVGAVVGVHARLEQ